MNTAPENEISNSLIGLSIPPEPQVLVDIHMEQAMPNPDLGHVAELISKDAGLSGSTLKVVNSKCYGLTNTIQSVKQAVEILGLDSIANIVNGLSIKGQMSDETLVSMTRFWDSATNIAMIAAAVSKRIGYQSPDLAYNLGLFHNCGIPLLMQRHTNYLETMQKGYEQENERIIDSENQIYKTNHAVIGYYIAKSWHCPKALCEVIAEHHNVDRIFNSNCFESYEANKKTLLSILKISEHICGLYQTLGNQQIDNEWERICTPLFDYLGLTQHDFETIVDSVKELGIIT